MKHYIFIDKILPLSDVKIYGSVKALVHNEPMIIGSKKQTYDTIMYKLSKRYSKKHKSPTKTFEDENYFIKRVDVIRQKPTFKK